MRVLGIDPGTAACGYGVVMSSGSRLKVVDYGWWSTRAGDRTEQRLKEIFDGVSEIVDDRRPEAVAIEDSYVGADARTALSVGQARGAILVACATAGLECAEYPPATIKQTVCGYGRADKGQVQRMVKSILGLSELPTPNHASDALAVAICHTLASPLMGLAETTR